jgi:hypothetical protein
VIAGVPAPQQALLMTRRQPVRRKGFRLAKRETMRWNSRGEAMVGVLLQTADLILPLS